MFERQPYSSPTPFPFFLRYLEKDGKVFTEKEVTRKLTNNILRLTKGLRDIPIKLVNPKKNKQTDKKIMRFNPLSLSNLKGSGGETTVVREIEI